MTGILAQSLPEINMPEMNLPEMAELRGWMNIDLLLNLTMIVTAIWLILNIFIYWRRSVTNLTPVEAPSPNSRTQPAFLSRDRKARKKALRRGDAYAKSLTKRERRELRQQNASSPSNLSRILGYLACAAALISLATVLIGCLLPQSLPGQWMSHYSSNGRLTEIIQTKPIAIIVCLFVTGFFAGLAITRKLGTAQADSVAT